MRSRTIHFSTNFFILSRDLVPLSRRGREQCRAKHSGHVARSRDEDQRSTGKFTNKQFIVLTKEQKFRKLNVCRWPFSVRWKFCLTHFISFSFFSNPRLFLQVLFCSLSLHLSQHEVYWLSGTYHAFLYPFKVPCRFWPDYALASILSGVAGWCFWLPSRLYPWYALWFTWHQCGGSVTFWYGSGFGSMDPSRIRIRILLFALVIFKMATKNYFFF